jgi:Regulator of ribonuclease activity B
VLLQYWEDCRLLTDTNTDNHALRAVALRRKNQVVTKVKDDGEDTGVTYSLPSDSVHLDGELDGVVGWRPRDVDGEALDKLKENGFDFSKPRLVEFTVDFSSWPPHREAMKRLARDYPSVAVCRVNGDRDGYLEFQVYALVSYELVTNIQSHVTELMAPYNGVCSSWAVLPTAPTLG